jgi:secreted Zn-dependent insulinase-like peptidase
MAYLYEIMNTKYKNSTQAEKETEIRKEMIRGLVKFTRGDLQIESVQSIEYARRKREKLDWKVMLEKAIEREMIQGMPQGDKETTQREVTTQSRNQLVSHRTGGTSQITWETTPQRKR